MGEGGVWMAPRAVAPTSALGVLLAVVLALVALVTAPTAALVSRMAWRPDLVTVPYGLVLGVGASIGVVLLAGAVTKAYGLLAAAAWLVGLAFVVKGTTGGSFVIAGDGLGWAFLLAGTVGTIGAALWGGRRP